MAYELLIGIDVLDDALYQEYRQRVMPILQSYGGGFGYDFKVSEVLKSESAVNINRVFTLYFPTSTQMEKFFFDVEYLDVKSRYLDTSVASSTIISGYDKVAL